MTKVGIVSLYVVNDFLGAVALHPIPANVILDMLARTVRYNVYAMAILTV